MSNWLQRERQGYKLNVTAWGDLIQKTNSVEGQLLENRQDELGFTFK